MNKSVLTVLWVFSASALLYAARPFTTDDAGTVEDGKFELETAADYWDNAATFGVGIKHGLTGRMDLGVGFGYTAAPEEEKAFSGLETSVKFAFIPGFLAGSFSGSLGDASYSMNLILSHSTGIVSLNVNCGAETEAGIRDACLTYGFAAVVEVKKIACGAEIGGTDDRLNWWQAGAQYALTDWMAVDAGIGGDFESSDAVTATTGFTFSF